MRRILCHPSADYYKPAGIPIRSLEEQVLYRDELESLRLADLEGHYHEQGAQRMGISRATFGRILENARRKVTDALVHGKALRIADENHERKGDTIMPQRDGTGPAGQGPGQGRGPCGCGRRRGRGGRGGWGFRDDARAGGDEPLERPETARRTAPNEEKKTEEAPS